MPAKPSYSKIQNEDFQSWKLVSSLNQLTKLDTNPTSLTSGVVLRRSSSSRGSIPLRNETVRRRSYFGFVIGIGIGITPPLLFALVLLLLVIFPANDELMQIN